MPAVRLWLLRNSLAVSPSRETAFLVFKENAEKYYPNSRILAISWVRSSLSLDDAGTNFIEKTADISRRFFVSTT